MLYLQYGCQKYPNILQDLLFLSFLAFELLEIYEYKIKQIIINIYLRNSDITSLTHKNYAQYSEVMYTYITILFLVINL